MTTCRAGDWILTLLHTENRTLGFEPGALPVYEKPLRRSSSALIFKGRINLTFRHVQHDVHQRSLYWSRRKDLALIASNHHHLPVTVVPRLDSKWFQEWGLLPFCHVQPCRTCDKTRMQIFVHRVFSIEDNVVSYRSISKSVTSFNYLHPFQVSKVTPPPGQMHTTRKTKVFSTKNLWFFRPHFEIMEAITGYHSDTFSGIPKEKVYSARK